MPEEIAAKIEDFFSRYRLRAYDKGQVLILYGDNPGTVFYIVEGRVKQYDVTYRGDEAILNIFKEPAFFPMSLAIHPEMPNQFTYEAETRVQVRQAPAADVVAFLHDNPDVLFDLLSRVYRGVEGLLGRTAHLMGGSARSRLIYELLLEARRFGTKQPDKSMLLSVNESQIGARAGLTRETVSRELRTLKADGIVGVSPKGVQLLDVAALENRLGQEV